FASGALGSGSITFGGGTLQYVSGNTQDLSGRVLSSAASMRIDPNGNSVIYASALGASNTAGLNVTGGGTLVLAASNAYSGPTIVSAGVLLVDGSTSAATNIDVNGGTLGGTGSVAGDVTVESAGALAPGDP